jgi:hypothetical protein
MTQFLRAVRWGKNQEASSGRDKESWRRKRNDYHNKLAAVLD